MKEKFDPLFGKALKEKVFPGAAVGIFSEKTKEKYWYYGKTSIIAKTNRDISERAIFDLASLTKPLATTLCLLALIKEKKIKITDKLPLFFKKTPDEKKEITIEHLLNHCGGFKSYDTFYQKIKEKNNKTNKNTIIKKIIKEKLEYPVGGKTVYSDLGFILLGKLIEIVSGSSLNIFAAEKIFSPLGLEEELFFNPLSNAKKKKDFVATEYCPWRKKLLCGEVSDENTYAVGGVSGQAGLFGTCFGVVKLCSHLLGQWQDIEKHPAYRNEDLRFFMTRHIVKESSRVLGFDTPSENSASGRFFSKKSVGHLGFTGTSFWIDLEKGVVVVLLTNRVHPCRTNEKIKVFRPVFHNTVMEIIAGA